MSEIPPERPLVDFEGRAIDAAAPTSVPPADAAPPAAGLPRSVRGRLAWLYTSLALLAIGGVIALVFGLVADSPSTSGRSADEIGRGGSPYARTQEIANTISRRYRAADGSQLTSALAGPPIIVSNQPEGSTQILVRAIAIRADLPSGGSSSDRDVVIVDGTTNVQYVLCGYGQNCSIAKGQPSVERHTLLRREALELALATFKNVPSIDSVSVFLPPRPDGAAAPTMVFLQRKDVASELSHPIEETLSAETPGIGRISVDELDRVNRATSKRLYQYTYTQAQDQSAVMLLDPVVT